MYSITFNKNILSIEVQGFIKNNLNSNLTSLILKGIPFSSVESKEIIEQIDAKKRCKTKLSTWFSSEKIYYPNKLNIEQTSSETTAKYKTGLIQGNSILDLTGGFGVDCYFFAKQFKQVTHCEISKELSEIVTHNFKQLQVENIKTIATDGLAYIKNTISKYDWIYLDPSRRNDSKGKVFFLKDCLPNVPEQLEFLFSKTNNVLIKTSPLLDITAGINDLKNVKAIHIVAINNAVKELLWVLEKNYKGATTIETCNIKKDKNEVFSFKLDEESSTYASYSLPLTYLYEPNAAIMKSGAFDTIASKLALKKLHKHSHLYTNESHIDFPGRIFKIEKIIAYSKKLLKQESFVKANISIRNFPESVDQIRKKHSIKEGGTIYLFFTTNINDSKIVLVCSKLI